LRAGARFIAIHHFGSRAAIRANRSGGRGMSTKAAKVRVARSLSPRHSPPAKVKLIGLPPKNHDAGRESLRIGKEIQFPSHPMLLARSARFRNLFVR